MPERSLARRCLKSASTDASWADASGARCSCWKPCTRTRRRVLRTRHTPARAGPSADASSPSRAEQNDAEKDARSRARSGRSGGARTLRVQGSGFRVQGFRVQSFRVGVCLQGVRVSRGGARTRNARLSATSRFELLEAKGVS